MIANTSYDFHLETSTLDETRLQKVEKWEWQFWAFSGYQASNFFQLDTFYKQLDKNLDSDRGKSTGCYVEEWN